MNDGGKPPPSPILRRDLATCERKMGFATKQKAKEYAKRCRKSGKSLRVYPCDYCGEWHLTTRRTWKP